MCKLISGPSAPFKSTRNAKELINHSNDDSGCSDDPDQSSTVLNYLQQLKDDYATGADSVVTRTQEKQFDEQNWWLDGSEFHTPAQQSKRLRLSSVSPVKRNEMLVCESDSDGIERDSLFDSTLSSKRRFKCPLQQWSFIKEWSLEEYDREIISEEITAIMQKSLEDADSKVFI